MVEDSIAPSTSIEERCVHVNGQAIPYLAAGDSGPVIVLVHGAGGSRWEWTDSMSHLASRNRVVAPDLIGFGDSPRRDIVHTTEYLGKFLAEFLHAVGIDRGILVGHSLGGRVCLEVALHRPEAAEGLVLIAPLGFGALSVLGRILNTGAWWVNRLLRRRQPYPKLEISLEEPDPNVFSGIRCDSILIWGSRDPYFPLANSEQALKAIPNSTLTVLEGGGHAPHRSHLEQFTSSIQEFVQRRA